MCVCVCACVSIAVNGIVFQVLVREVGVMKDLIRIESGGRERAGRPTIGIRTHGMMIMDDNATP